MPQARISLAATLLLNRVAATWHQPNRSGNDGRWALSAWRTFDRIRGIVNVYSYCRTHCIPFRIHHVYPFNLTDYFEPAHIDCASKQELSYNSNEAYPVVLQAVHLQQKLHSLYLRQTLKRHKGKQIHVYSNTVMNDKAFHDNFNHLFQPPHFFSKPSMPYRSSLIRAM